MEKWVNGLVYMILTFIYSTLTFIVLLPELKNVLYTKCVWKFNFIFCNKIFGIEAAYRFTIAIFAFYIMLSLVTSYRGNQLLWHCQDSCFTKTVLLVVSNVVGFTFPFSRSTMEGLYHLFLISSALFIFMAFFSMIDWAHALRMLWIKKAQENDDPTCYLCTWLFLIHLVTAFLYALTLDLILAFFFFNKLEDCVNTLMLLLLNICLCLLCCSISYFPSLRQRECSSQIIFATLLFLVVFVTWLALSDPENELCNMYGTIFSGSILESSTSFRSLASLTLTFPVLLFLCFKDSDTQSFVRSLIIEESSHSKWLQYCNNFFFHVTMATVSGFVLMSVTNFYEPVHSVVETSGTFKRGIKTSVVYFEGYNRFRFLLICGLSALLPTFYLCILTSRVAVCVYENWRKERDERLRRSADEEGKDDDDRTHSTMKNNEFIYIAISLADALKQLKFSPDVADRYEHADGDLRFILLQCFYVTGLNLTYWLFPRYISQTYFKGRNGSNACTIISMIIGRFFARSDLLYQNNGYLSHDWLNLFYTSIEDGNSFYDTLIKEVGVLDLSIEEVYERIGASLNLVRVFPSLPVSFEDEVETVTIYYQLKQLLQQRQKIVCLFIYKKRTSSFLIYQDGGIVYADSHAFGTNGAIMMSVREDDLKSFLDFLRELLSGNTTKNQLGTLTVLEYEKRRTNHVT